MKSSRLSGMQYNNNISLTETVCIADQQSVSLRIFQLQSDFTLSPSPWQRIRHFREANQQVGPGGPDGPGGTGGTGPGGPGGPVPGPERVPNENGPADVPPF